jgi:hypothetical protein
LSWARRICAGYSNLCRLLHPCQNPSIFDTGGFANLCPAASLRTSA